MNDSANHIAPKGPKNKELPPIEFLRECVRYEPDTGKAFWKERPRSHFSTENRWLSWNSRWMGKEIGCKSYLPNGRRQYMLFGLTDPNGKRFLLWVHHVIFLLEGTVIPTGMMVDHKNGDIWDNRRDNLRIVTPLQNSINCETHKDRIVDLPRNILTRKDRKGFWVRLTVGGKPRWFGTHPTVEEAVKVRDAKDIEFNGEHARASSRKK